MLPGQVCAFVQRGARELELDGETAARRVREPHRAAVGRDEPLHDRQAEAGAGLAACAEPKEGAGPLLRGMPGPSSAMVSVVPAPELATETLTLPPWSPSASIALSSELSTIKFLRRPMIRQLPRTFTSP